MKRAPMDHDIIIDRALRVHIVFGSVHPPGRIFTYVKYIPYNTREPGSYGPWRFRGVPLKRVMERYSVGHVERVIREHHEEHWDPVYGSEMPSIGYLDVMLHLAPEERAYEVYTNPRDRLEEIASELMESVVRVTGIRLGEIGIGGSILGSFHSAEISDIDLVIYGCRNAEEIYQKAEEIGSPLSGEKLRRWIENATALQGVSIDVARSMYSPYRRILFRSVETTFVFPEDPRRYGDEISISTGKCVEARLEIEGGQCRALQYPARAEVARTLEITGIEARIAEVVSYEGTYSPILYRGGIFRVRGLAQLVIPRYIYRIAVGTRECGGYVAPQNQI